MPRHGYVLYAALLITLGPESHLWFCCLAAPVCAWLWCCLAPALVLFANSLHSPQSSTELELACMPSCRAHLAFSLATWQRGLATAAEALPGNTQVLQPISNAAAALRLLDTISHTQRLHSRHCLGQSARASKKRGSHTHSNGNSRHSSSRAQLLARTRCLLHSKASSRREQGAVRHLGQQHPARSLQTHQQQALRRRHHRTLPRSLAGLLRLGPVHCSSSRACRAEQLWRSDTHGPRQRLCRCACS